MVRAFDEVTRKRAAMARRVKCIMYEGMEKERRDDGWVGLNRVGPEIAFLRCHRILTHVKMDYSRPLFAQRSAHSSPAYLRW